jgi:SAM-dependent methyltransferase
VTGWRRIEAVTGDHPWDGLAERFVRGHYGGLYGRVRTYVIDRQLREHLPPPPCDLADVGGGAGNQSLPLARDGYQVTIIDPSQAMLDLAAERLAAEPREVARRVRLVRADTEQAPAAVGGRRFGAVLSHGVILYVPEPAPFVAALADLAEPGGIVSLVAKNARTLASRPALRGNWAEALAAFDASHQVNGLGVDTRGDTLEDLTATLAAVGVRRVAWYGVRLFTDGWTRQDAAAGGEDEILAVEFEASRRDPYRLLSRLFHIVGVRE